MPNSARPHPWLRRLIVLNLVVEVLIVVTGGLVRLTGSGLGCPTWPQCVPGSYTPVPHQAQGWHKYIEFGNRTMTSVVSVAAVLVIVALFVWARDRPRLRRPAYLVLAGVVTQAVIGGITVLTGLNPAIVAGHFLVSMVLVAASTVLLVRVDEGDGPRVPLARQEIRVLSRVTAALAGIILVLGTIVTGSGPHSGDANEPARLAVDPRSASWLHADSVMLFVGLVVAGLLAVRLTAVGARATRAWTVLLGVTLGQGVVGYVQYFTGLPWAVVLVHMLGASLLVVALVYAVLSLRERPAVPQTAHPAEHRSGRSTVAQA
ncbi:MAG TPA: COX15/CtaA family protein [Segeticoccus sp.]|uniref:COX15/CtaA family protein n=1 Tax=Segeticoccus sp. TaxID=2706531 RepID=UPI002D7E3F90|nr:COX15/CtaA family protein [Segeticoccus sp.]HET8600238.1 COX15/CtaA family protein [Segeticoccus sp.]